MTNDCINHHYLSSKNLKNSISTTLLKQQIKINNKIDRISIILVGKMLVRIGLWPLFILCNYAYCMRIIFTAHKSIRYCEF